MTLNAGDLWSMIITKTSDENEMITVVKQCYFEGFPEEKFDWWKFNKINRFTCISFALDTRAKLTEDFLFLTNCIAKDLSCDLIDSVSVIVWRETIDLKCDLEYITHGVFQVTGLLFQKIRSLL